MIDITQYLQDIYEDLQGYVDNDVCLCKFKELNFEAGALPDYEEVSEDSLLSPDPDYHEFCIQMESPLYSIPVPQSHLPSA